MPAMRGEGFGRRREFKGGGVSGTDRDTPTAREMPWGTKPLSWTPDPPHSRAVGGSLEDASRLTASPGLNSLGNPGLLHAGILADIRGFHGTERELFNELFTTQNGKSKNIFNVL